MAEKVVIGNAELWHGDCREILPTLPECDLILTDPPYGIGIGGMVLGNQVSHHGTAWDNEPPPDWMFGLMLEKAQTQIIWGGNYFALPPTKCWLLWDKETAGVTSFADAEVAWTNLDKAMRLKRHLWSGPYMKVKEVREHPTQKPLAIIEWCIEMAGDVVTVCDPYMGSGTTGVACANHGKRFTGIERERKYFDIACERIYNAQRQNTLFPQNEGMQALSHNQAAIEFSKE